MFSFLFPHFLEVLKVIAFKSHTESLRNLIKTPIIRFPLPFRRLSFTMSLTVANSAYNASLCKGKTNKLSERGTWRTIYLKFSPVIIHCYGYVGKQK